jgi:hypothetical protein
VNVAKHVEQLDGSWAQISKWKYSEKLFKNYFIVHTLSKNIIQKLPSKVVAFAFQNHRLGQAVTLAGLA